jgi:hypothetical protein
MCNNATPNRQSHHPCRRYPGSVGRTQNAKTTSATLLIFLSIFLVRLAQNPSRKVESCLLDIAHETEKRVQASDWGATACQQPSPVKPWRGGLGEAEWMRCRALLLTAQLQRLAHSLLLAVKTVQTVSLCLSHPAQGTTRWIDGHGRREVPLFGVHDGKVVRKMTAEVEQRQARDMTKARVQLHVIIHFVTTSDSCSRIENKDCLPLWISSSGTL